MQNKILLKFLMCMLLSQILIAKGEDSFGRGVAYYLLGDFRLAGENITDYFRYNPDQVLERGYDLLLKNKTWESTSLFKDYLDKQYRSIDALIGIALSTTDMKDNSAKINLKRAEGLKSTYSPILLCLGFEYYKNRNFRLAERYFNRAIRYSSVLEYKIILGKLYLEIGENKLASDILTRETSALSHNFYLNYFVASSLLKQNDLKNVGKYLDTALQINPGSNEVKLLKAEYLIDKGEFKEAQSLLTGIKLKNYNVDYVKMCAHVLVKLKDKKAAASLYEVFYQEKWDPDINKLFGLYYLNRKKNSNVQHWIYRAILSGSSPEGLKSEFSDKFIFPIVDSLSFFEVAEIEWLPDNKFLVVARRKSEDNLKIFVIDSKNMKILKTLKYQGKFQKFFVSADRKNILLSTVAEENARVYMYALKISGRYFSLKPVLGYALELAAITAGFDDSGSVCYITDASIRDYAFESPFSKVSVLGKKEAFYPGFSLPLFTYNFKTGKFSVIKSKQQYENVPIEVFQKILLIADAYRKNNEIKKLIQRGEKLDISSSDTVKIFFQKDLSSFLIYLSDLKNTFQAIIYDRDSGKILKTDGSMFMGKKKDVDLKILSLDSKRNEIIVMTNDENRNLINFNYHSRLYKKLCKYLVDFCYNQDQETVFLLSERKKQGYLSETRLDIVSLDPFSVQKIKGLKNLDKILKCGDIYNAAFSTNNGEILIKDDDNNFQYAGTAFEGAEHSISPSGKKTVVFINSRLYCLDQNWYQ